MKLQYKKTRSKFLRSDCGFEISAKKYIKNTLLPDALFFFIFFNGAVSLWGKSPRGNEKAKREELKYVGLVVYGEGEVRLGLPRHGNMEKGI